MGFFYSWKGQKRKEGCGLGPEEDSWDRNLLSKEITQKWKRDTLVPRRAKQKFLGKKKVATVVGASTVVKSPLWASAKGTGTEGMSSAFA